MHESGRYLFPGSGEVRETGSNGGVGFSVNLPLEPYTDDESWISCFEAVVPEVLRAFDPDLILSQNGCDGHALDPLTHLCATTRLYEYVPRRMHDLAHDLCGGRWIATGGGGYDIWRVVPRAWTALWAALSHQEMPENVAENWLSRWGPKSPVKLAPFMRDDPADYPQVPRVARIAARNEIIVQEVLGKVLPKIR
jgi:acetoin utilization protein AcuC